MDRSTRTPPPAGSLVLAAAGSLLLAPAAPAQPAETTTIDEIVMYALDSDTRDLLRYEFISDSFTVIGRGIPECCG